MSPMENLKFASCVFLLCMPSGPSHSDDSNDSVPLSTSGYCSPIFINSPGKKVINCSITRPELVDQLEQTWHQQANAGQVDRDLSNDDKAIPIDFNIFVPFGEDIDLSGPLSRALVRANELSGIQVLGPPPNGELRKDGLQVGSPFIFNANTKLSFAPHPLSDTSEVISLAYRSVLSEPGNLTGIVQVKFFDPLEVPEGAQDLFFHILSEARGDVEASNSEGITPLIAASLAGDLDLVRDLVEQRGAGVDKITKAGTALLAAIESDHFHIAKYLVEDAHADINLVAHPQRDNPITTTPLGRAIIDTRGSITEFLLSAGASVDPELPEFFDARSTFMGMAIELDNHRGIEALVNIGGIDPNHLIEPDVTPLAYAIIFEKEAAIRALHRVNADFNLLSGDRRPIDVALFGLPRYGTFPTKQKRILRLLINSGSNQNFIGFRESLPLTNVILNSHDRRLNEPTQLAGVLIDNNPPLHTVGGYPMIILAARFSTPDLIEQFHSAGASVNELASNGLDALHMAVLVRRFDNASKLIELGANRITRNGEGGNLLHTALRSSNRLDAEEFNLLADFVARHEEEIDQFDDLDYSPLLYAVADGEAGIVKGLLERGADPNKKRENYGGISALHLASYSQNLEIVEALVACGADIGALDNDGYGVLTYFLGNQRAPSRRSTKDQPTESAFRQSLSVEVNRCD